MTRKQVLVEFVNMTLIIGKYQHYKNEDIEDYFAAVGVPYIGRKMINVASPSIEITLDGDMMTIKESALIFKSENTFRLGEEYDEQMPRKTIKSVTTMINNHELMTNSVIPDTGDKCGRHYHFTEDECIVTFTHEKARNGKRYFRRVKEI